MNVVSEPESNNTRKGGSVVWRWMDCMMASEHGVRSAGVTVGLDVSGISCGVEKANALISQKRQCAPTSGHAQLVWPIPFCNEERC
jgi:hypothetical protein